MIKSLIIDDNLQSPVRLDSYISEEIDGLSRSRVQSLIKSGKITVNCKSVKPSFCISAGDVVEIDIPEPVPCEAVAENIPLDIIYEDDDILIVNKPKGMSVHPGAGHLTGTLVNALLYHCKDDLSGINGVMRPGIVHRIDKDTSGALIVCKNDEAHSFIAAQLAEHSIKRRYIAIVRGHLPALRGTVNKPIGRNPKDRKKMAIVEGGRRAVTHYSVLEEFKDYTYAEFRLETGRTHQIRVHMASIGHPLLGDEIYGSGKSKYKTEGQALHAESIGFIHPKGREYVEFHSPVPEYFEKILNDLRNR